MSGFTTFRRRLVQVAVLTALLVVAASCGGEGDEVAASSTTEALTTTSTTEVDDALTTSTTVPADTATTTLSPSAPSDPAATTPATPATPAPTSPTTELVVTYRPVAELEAALQAVIPERYPMMGTGVVDCAAGPQVSTYQPVVCSYLPDEPMEIPLFYVSVLPGDRFGYGLGACCHAAPRPDDYASGLYCRDLIEPPVDAGPSFPADSDHLTYGLAMWYWLTEGRPDRMDADLDGRPCETVYPRGEVDDFWATLIPLG